MTLYDDYRNTDYLDDVSFIAGTEMVLNFPIYDDAGNTINVNGFTMKWVLGYYGQPEATPVLQKTAVQTATHIFTVTLTESDTLALGGDIYLQQMKITDGAGKIMRPAQGIVIIRKAIPIT